jgi:hypothetical protein
MLSPRAFFPFLAVLALVVAGCREPKVTAYRAPKDPPPAAPAGGDELVWTAPADWESVPPVSPRKATYIIHGDKDAKADLSIIVFPGVAGGELANLNRWRSQLQLPDVTDPDATLGVTHQEQAGLKLTLVDFASLPPALSQRMLGVIVPTGANTWFFKLSGPADLLDQAKGAFADFVKTIRPATPVAPSASSAAVAPAPAASSPMAATAVPTASGPDLTWTAPTDWSARPASPMRKATFAVPGDNGTEGEVAITAFPGEVGGELANLNRWRGLINLPPVADAATAPGVTRFEQGGLKFTIADFSSLPPAPPQRMLGAIVPAGGDTWFFKLTGPAPVIEKQKAAFLAFLKTVKAP